VTDQELQVTFAKRAHNPLRLAAGLDQTEVAVPWLGHRRLNWPSLALPSAAQGHKTAIRIAFWLRGVKSRN